MRVLRKFYRRQFGTTSRTSRMMIAYADGACRGNPGRGSCGAYIQDPITQEIIISRARIVGDQTTNNVTEYEGLSLALELAHELQITMLQIRMDSQLIVRQMRGDYRVSAPHLRTLNARCTLQSNAFDYIEYLDIPREQNKLADQLANDILNQT